MKNRYFILSLILISCLGFLAGCIGVRSPVEPINPFIWDWYEDTAEVDDEFLEIYKIVKGYWVNEENTAYVNFFKEDGKYYMDAKTSDDSIEAEVINCGDIYNLSMNIAENGDRTIHYFCSTNNTQYQGSLEMPNDKSCIRINGVVYYREEPKDQIIY